MKNFLFLFIVGLTFLTTNLQASNTSTEDSRCVWDSWFIYPKQNQFKAGQDVYVKLGNKRAHDIAYVKLFIDGQFVRKEIKYPFEWGRPGQGGDHQLRNLRPGKHEIVIIVKDKCGYQHKKFRTIYVKGHGGNNNRCHFKNPIQDFSWLNRLHHKFPNYYICQYELRGKVFFRIYRTNAKNCYEYWYDCTGKLICKFFTGARKPASISRCAFVKCWYKCNTPNPNCHVNFWFKQPTKEHFKVGENIYFNVATNNARDIKYMELFVNGRSLGKETNAPYEWGTNSKGSNFFRSLRPGTYKFVVVVYDRCGKSYKKYCTIKIKGRTAGHACKFKFWFKTIKTCTSGRDIFVTVDTDNHKDIAYVELYVNNRFVRKEVNYPFEWGKPNSRGDYALRNCRPGIYKLKCVVVSRCGKRYEKFWTVKVNRKHT